MERKRNTVGDSLLGRAVIRRKSLFNGIVSLSFSLFLHLSLMRGVHVATSCGRIAGAQNRPRVYRWAVQRTFGVCTCIKYRALPGYSLARVINPPRRVVAQSFRLGGVAPRQRTQRTLSESKFIAT